MAKIEKPQSHALTTIDAVPAPADLDCVHARSPRLVTGATATVVINEWVAGRGEKCRNVERGKRENGRSERASDGPVRRPSELQICPFAF